MTESRMKESKDELHVLQVTDCHLLSDPNATLLGVPTQASFDAVLRAACAECAPDAVLATGDLAQQPTAATYQRFLAAVRRYFDGPLLCVPGNHDHGDTFSDQLPTADVAIGGWRLVGVDTHVDDEVGGSVGAVELDRLATALGGGPTLVAGHHCPAAIGCPWLDEHRIDDGDELLDALVATNVAAYVFGHIHQEADRRLAGLRLLGTPSTCFQFAYNTSAFALDNARPGCRWLTLAADGSVATRVARADDFDLTLDLKDRGNR